MHDILTEIWQTARRNKLRTTLTGFAVAWGIFMIIVLLGAGNGLINATMKMSSDFLTNSMEVYEGMTSKAYKGLKEGRYIRLNSKDLDATDAEFNENVDEVGACYYYSTTVSNGEQYMNMQIAGVYPVHTQIVKEHLICGRFINDIDQKERRKVLVLNDRQAKELEVINRSGKWYLRITDYEGLRTLIGELLHEVQRIISEGDYDAAAHLVANYAVKVKYAQWHENIYQRYEMLDFTPHQGFVNPVYKPKYDENGNLIDVVVELTESFVEQNLRYSSDYSNLPDIND